MQQKNRQKYKEKHSQKSNDKDQKIHKGLALSKVGRSEKSGETFALSVLLDVKVPQCLRNQKQRKKCKSSGGMRSPSGAARDGVLDSSRLADTLHKSEAMAVRMSFSRSCTILRRASSCCSRKLKGLDLPDRNALRTRWTSRSMALP